MTDVVQIAKTSSGVKAHSSLCWELRKALDMIGCILPAIESAHPGCKSGIKELCSLNNTTEKAKLLIQHCAESSMLYLAITAEATLLRCERIRTSWDQSLCQIKDMVPQPLADQIFDVVSHLRNAKFVIDSTDEEAGKAMLELLRQTDTNEELEFKAFQIAAVSLNITSPKALLIERRSIQKLLDKVRGNDPKKERILDYFLFLLKKYGKKVKPDGSEQKVMPDGSEQKERASSQETVSITDSKCETSVIENKELTDYGDTQTNVSSSNTLPAEFCCPISSKLMYDPVVIASGQTYERTSIEKWFSEGHDTCPKTQKKLESCSMIPNTCMKDLISHWCGKHGLHIHDQDLQPAHIPLHSWESSHSSSISSLKNVSAALLYGNIGDHILQNSHSDASFVSSDATYFPDSSENSENSHAQMFPWSVDYRNCSSFSNFSHDMFVRFFGELSELQSELQGKALDDLKILLEDDTTCYAMLSNDFTGALMTFLDNTKDQSNVQAQKLGAHILLTFQSKSRAEIPETAFQLLTSFIDSDIATEALMIMQNLTSQPNFIYYIEASGVPPPLKNVLDSEDNELLELAVNIIYDLSSHSAIKSHISSSGCIAKLVPLLSERNLSELCLKIMRNLCDSEDAARMIAETDECLASIAEVLETGTRKEQEHAVGILHSLCSRSHDYCWLVLKEGVIPSLVDISVNGNPKGMDSSMKLLHLLRDVRHSDQVDNPEPLSGSASTLIEDFIEPSTKSVPTSKSSGFFGRKMKFFSKSKPLALF